MGINDQPDNVGVIARAENSANDDQGGPFRVVSQKLVHDRTKRRSMIEKYTFNSVTKKNSCRICHKEFSKPCHVVRHIKAAHEGLRHTCTICGKNYSDRTGLRLHIKAAHEGLRHPCKICGKNYSEISGLRRHNISAHMNVNDP